MKKIFFFVVAVLCWPLVTVFTFLLQTDQITTSEYITNFAIYSVVGLISVPFLVSFFFKSQTNLKKVYVLGGYLIVVPWVYIVFIYFSSIISPILIVFFASSIPVIGCYLGYKFGKD